MRPGVESALSLSLSLSISLCLSTHIHILPALARTGKENGDTRRVLLNRHLALGADKHLADIIGLCIAQPRMDVAEAERVSYITKEV